MDQEVHKKLCRSIVRISIDIASEGEKTKFVLIPGIIIASNDKSCHILALDKYFVCSTKTKFSVNFPKNGGVLKYEIEKSSVTMGDGIATFDVLAERAGYDTSMIEAVQFGEHTVSRCEDVFTFILPEYPMPSRLPPGSVIHASKDFFYHDCSSDGSAHLGSPVFNEKGYLVGMCYSSSGYLSAWTVPFIATMLSYLHNLKGCEGIQDYMQYINKREL